MLMNRGETILHLASLLGHFEFVDQLLTLNPELAEELDFRKASPLNLATSKGYLDIVIRLVQVNPNMCHVCDRNERNPLHIAAIKGHILVLKELVQARPQASRMLMNRGETILHGCVRYNQLEAMKFLVETFGDYEFVNSKNTDGNTILHQAVTDQQIQAVNFLIASTSVEVNSLNANGFTPLDLLSQNGRGLKDLEIVASLQNAGANSSDILPSQQFRWKKSVKNHSDWLEKKRNALMVVASLIATIACQAGTNPPSGVWQDSNEDGSRSNIQTAGASIMAYNNPNRYQGCNYSYGNDIYVVHISFHTFSGIRCLFQGVRDRNVSLGQFDDATFIWSFYSTINQDDQISEKINASKATFSFTGHEQSRV
ncbi:hypothetical protein REPUB_Repub18cG0071400 [Reevesia pubescens]